MHVGVCVHKSGTIAVVLLRAVNKNGFSQAEAEAAGASSSNNIPMKSNVRFKIGKQKWNVC